MWAVFQNYRIVAKKHSEKEAIEDANNRIKRDRIEYTYARINKKGEIVVPEEPSMGFNF